MTIAGSTQLHSLEDYRQREERTEGRHEYRDGEIIEMSGGTLEHSLISGNVFAALRALCRRTAFKPFNSDLRIWIPAYQRGTYADVMVVESEAQFTEGRRDEVLNPSLIVEVLSQSTEAYDRGDKFRFYRSIPSFREYLLVSQSSALVEQYVRSEDGDWRLRSYEGMEAEIELGIGLGSLVMIEIYEDVALGI